VQFATTPVGILTLHPHGAHHAYMTNIPPTIDIARAILKNNTKTERKTPQKPIEIFSQNITT